MSITRVYVRDVDLPLVTPEGTLPRGGGKMALLTLDNGEDHRRPNLIGTATLAELHAVLLEQQARAARGEIQALGVTGKPYCFAAGADLKQIGDVTTREQALELGRAGHAAYSLLAELGVPSFAFVNGIALGGGLELALACDYRTASGNVPALGLPETSLGLIPGWGGSTLLPRLVGTEAAIDIITKRPAANKTLSPHDAGVLDVVDRVLEAPDFLVHSIRWASEVVAGREVRRREVESNAEAAEQIAAARAALELSPLGAYPAPRRALDLIAQTRDLPLAEAYALEDEALADLIMTDEMRASVYAFSLVTGAKRPLGAPAADAARPVTRVGIIGAGLMAAQIALLVARKLRVPVVMRDIDTERAEAGLEFVRADVEKALHRGRIQRDTAERVLASISATTDLSDLAGCDLVIEAVTERLDLKKRVFAEVEAYVGPQTVLATNTSALSVTEMARDLCHPERVVGLHFFNPVAAMPLVEVVRAEQTDEAALATAYAVTKALGKKAVGSADRPGFIVNRLLVLMLGRVLGAAEGGTPVAVADRALDALGLPMPPFQLLDLVGPAVGLHVLESLRAELGDAFPASPGLETVVAEGRPIVGEAPAPGLPRRVLPELQEAFGEPGGSEALDEDGVLDDVVTALTREVGRMLDEGVVGSPAQIDTAMILGAGWPFHLGGLTPYLDRTGYSERLLGRRFTPDGVANAP